MRQIQVLEGKVVAPEGLKVGIIASRFNEIIVNKLLGGAVDGLVRHGVEEENITAAWVPGAFEIPVAASKMAKSGKYDALILNYANCDMVGHTGVFEAAVKAVEAVDTCIGRVEAAVKEMGGCILLTADHGNADRMVDSDGTPFTAHTTNPVPFCVINHPCELREGGVLADIAPTMLKVLGLPQPAEMTGESIIK